MFFCLFSFRILYNLIKTLKIKSFLVKGSGFDVPYIEIINSFRIFAENVSVILM